MNLLINYCFFFGHLICKPTFLGEVSRKFRVQWSLERSALCMFFFFSPSWLKHRYCCKANTINLLISRGWFIVYSIHTNADDIWGWFMYSWLHGFTQLLMWYWYQPQNLLEVYFHKCWSNSVINHPQCHHFYRWYVYHSQSWPGWWFHPPEKYESQIGSSSQLVGKTKAMFQTTNQQ